MLRGSAEVSRCFASATNDRHQLALSPLRCKTGIPAGTNRYHVQGSSAEIDEFCAADASVVVRKSTSSDGSGAKTYQFLHRSIFLDILGRIFDIWNGEGAEQFLEKDAQDGSSAASDSSTVWGRRPNMEYIVSCRCAS